MKRKSLIFLIIALTLVLALSLCACGLFGDKPDEPNDDPGDDPVLSDGWETYSTNMTDVYTKFLGGFTSIAGEFTKSELKNKPKVSADGTFKLIINGNDFWATLKMNYDDDEPTEAMAAIEVFDDKEKELKDIVFALYLYSEQIFIQAGETTKFSLDFEHSVWESFFPLDDFDMTVDKMALALSGLLVTDDSTVCKRRMNGLTEEYKFEVKIDLSKSMKNIFGGKFTLEDIDKYSQILTAIFGVTVQDIKDGNFPESSLQVNFTTSDMKMSALDARLQLDDISSTNSTIFGEESLDLHIDMENLAISNKNVSIPFVWEENADRRSEFVYYRDNAFKISLTSDVLVADDTVEEYLIEFKVKVFQENEIDNYAFIEIKDRDNGEVREGLYVYNDVAYLFTREDNELVCKLSFPFNLSAIATRTVSNDFDLSEEEKSSTNILDIISYITSHLNVGDEGISFDFDGDFFKYVWFNMGDMMDYVDDKYAENIYEIESLANFVTLVTSPAAISIRYDEPLIVVVPDGDKQLTDIINIIRGATPEQTLVPVAPPEV